MATGIYLDVNAMSRLVALQFGSPKTVVLTETTTDGSVPAAPAEAVLQEGPDVDEDLRRLDAALLTDFLGSDSQTAQREGPPAQAAAKHAVGPAEPPDEGNLQPEDFWKEMKRQRRQSAQTYAASQPYNRLYVARETLGPLRKYMTRVLSLSGGQWERKEAAKKAAGQPRSYLVLEAARGTDVRRAVTECLEILFHSPCGVHVQTFSCLRRTLRLATCASGMCSLHALLRMPREFHLVAEDAELELHADWLLQMPACMHDEFWASFSKLYPNKAMLLGTECRGLLQCIAGMAGFDVASIESAHSSTGEFANLRSRGWVSSLQEVSSRFVVLQRKRQNKNTHANAFKKQRSSSAMDAAEDRSARRRDKRPSLPGVPLFMSMLLGNLYPVSCRQP